MGIVFLARDVALDRPVAIKLLPPAYAHDADLRERFLREARTAGRLSHPNIVPIHAVEERGEVVFFVMAFVDGETLTERVARTGPLRTDIAVQMIREVAWALAYAHQNGVIHRDIKPDNILMEKVGNRALVTDFGIARAVEARTLTAVGEIIGSPHYMSPEQANGDEVHGRSDLYSLGAAGFFALTGTVPLDAPSLQALIAKHITEAPPPVGSLRPDLPPQLAKAVDRCLAKDPTARFSSGEELARVIGEVGTVRPMPQVIQLFLKEAQALTTEGFAYLSVTYVLSTWSTGDPAFLASANFFKASTLLALAAFWVVRLIRTASHARQVRRDGFAFSEVVRFLQGEKLPLGHAGRKQTATHSIWRRGIALRWRSSRHALLGSVGLLGFVAVNVFGSFRPEFFTQVTLAGGAGLLAFLASLLPLPLGEPSKGRLPLTNAVWSGPLGRLVFKLAGLGIKRAAESAPTPEPTEVLVRGAVESVYEELPGELRAVMSDVPRVIRRLEQVAQGLRARRSELEDALAQVGPTALRESGGPTPHADPRGEAVTALERAKASADERLASVLAAAEGIRLDLIRLRVGVASVEEITADIERAREIGEAVDTELSARREAEGHSRPHGSTG